VRFEVHPDYASQLAANPASRPARIEVKARGKTFLGESLFPRGSVTPDPATRLTNDDLAEKFIGNAEGILSTEQTDKALRMMWRLEDVENVRELIALVSGVR
jgi:2-methylcitrate dehydratase PrpD